MSQTPVIPDNAPFTGDQRAWINGYLAGLMAAGALAVRTGSASTPAPGLVILYGTQTGTAEALSHKIAKQAKGSGFAPQVLSMADHAGLPLDKAGNLLIVTSTYGEGDMPDNAQGFWEFLNSGAAPRLSGVRYSVLALGDRNYTHFCQAGKRFDARLAELGAERVHPMTECDVDYEQPAMAWTRNALETLAAKAGPAAPPAEIAARTSSQVAGAKGAPAPATWSKGNPYPARLAVNRLLTAAGSGKETRHFEIDLGDSGLCYEVGDALGVMPTNDPALVERLMALARCRAEDLVPVPDGRSLPLHEALLRHYDITRPGREFLAVLAERSGDAELAALLGPEASDALKAFLHGRSVAVLLAAHPGAHFAAAELVPLLRKLQPRLYSISSSLKAQPRSVHLTVGIVRYEAHGLAQGGVCSTFLADRAGDASVPVFVHASPGFKLPADPATPVIMVGPGTGVAPFRAFLQERRALGASGRNWLFFGEQHAATDFYYRDELEALVRDGFLHRLSTAFSRDQERKVYVQERMAEEAAELWRWLEEGAHFYVCGDASRMARDVDAMLHEVCRTAGGLSPEKASEYVKNLKTLKRYQRDVY